jgi:TonB family protein
LWVSLAHALVLLLALFCAHVLAPTPTPKMLEMVGLPDNLNPAEGEPSATLRGPVIPTPPSPAPPAAPPPTVPPPSAPPPPPPAPPAINHFPVEAPPPKPKPPKPKVPVKPNLDTTTRAPARAPANTRTPANSVAQSLNRAVSANPNAGVPGGSRNSDTGSPGSPTGSASGDWYRTLIKNKLEQHWMKPSSGNPNLTATIKIRVLADGTVEYLGMTGSSGDAAMDNSVVSAVRSVGKISPPPPDGFPKPYEDTVIFRLKNE